MAKSRKGAPKKELSALERLEGMVHQVGSILRELREENGHLKEMLERRGDGDDGAASWEEERAEIRRRVHRLTDHLEDLLSQD